MLKNIPQKRLLAYLMIIGLLPILFVMAGLYHRKGELEEVEERIGEVYRMEAGYKRRQAVNIAVRDHFRDADHFYIDKHVESMTFLEPEIEALRKIVENKNFAGDPQINSRLNRLTGPENSLVFSEGSVRSYPGYQETTETQIHPIEVNVDDLHRILAKIEGVAINSYGPGPDRPQLIVLDFKLDKKRHPNENETYVLNMKLLKREFP